MQIVCDKFTEKSITFHKGLNTIVGDEIASNSIGKSTLLMIVDFVFGGSEYIKKNHDAIEYLGHHEFNFMFEFSGEQLFFRRGTGNYLLVSVCDENYVPQKEIELADFTNLLQEKYKCKLTGLSFRSIVGRYFRIYGKENLNEHKPIQYFEKETAQKSILALVKLFNKYSILQSYEEQITNLTEQKKILSNAAKKELIPNVTKAAFSKNSKMIDDLSDQLDALKTDIVNSTTDIEALISKEILELKKQKSSLIIKRNALSARLSRIQTSMQSRSTHLDLEMAEFSEYFPDFNIEHAQKVDAFHNSLTKILREELQQADKDLRVSIGELNTEITEIDAKISSNLDLRDAPKVAVDKVVDLVAQIRQLKDENGYYTKAQNLNSSLKKAKDDLGTIKEKILDEICNQINTRMFEINKHIYGELRRAPTLNIHNDKYVFSTYGDTGTGTAFANLITFDLSLLDLTCLPAIAHDLPLLKNIENPALEKIISLYAARQKQIFIAIDKIHSYDENASETIEKYSVVHLSKNKTLFIMNWKSPNS